VTRDELSRWVDAYETAWRTAGTDGLAELFAADATYMTAPFERPHTGLDAIRLFWDAEREGPDEVFTMDYEVVAVEGDTGVVSLDVTNGEPARTVYKDLWVVRFDGDGRCVAFEEWPFWPPGERGAIAPGAA
jgi:ketosteroid isomerase-like protein